MTNEEILTPTLSFSRRGRWVVAAFLILAPTAASAALPPGVWASSAAFFSPSPWLNFDRSAAQIQDHCRQVREKVEGELKFLAAIPEANRSFSNTPVALEDAVWDLSDETASDTFLKDVSVSSDVRNAAHDCATEIEKFDVDVFSRADLYKAVKGYADKDEPLQGEDKRLLERELLDFKKNGLMLPETDRKALEVIRQRIVELQDQFDKNVAETTSYLLLSKDELAGMDQDYVARLPKIGGQYKVSVDYPDYYPFMQNAKNAGARRRLEDLFDNRGYPQNLPIFQETLKLRQQAAQLLGYPDHASYTLALENRMAENPQTVNSFLADLQRKLKPLGDDELKVLVSLKNKEEGTKSDGVIHLWDWRYYDAQLNKTQFAVNQEEIKQYFPLESVVSGMFEVYQKLLGVHFKEVPNAAAWAPDVALYEITNAGGGPVIGYFYTDLFPRPGKYKHAASFDIVKARLLPDGAYQKPVSAIVANFSKPAPGRPSYLTHGQGGEVETLFHEFGHVMHQTLTKAKYGRFSGSNVAEDFVEAPSQMMENWVWQPEVIKLISGPSKKFPADLFKKMNAAKNVDVGLRYLRQDFFATVDMRYHTKPLVEDPTEVYADLMDKIGLIEMPKGVHPELSFDHLMDGYDAGYYGYLWSKVYAQDMFSRFQAGGVLNPALGEVYRHSILEPGSSRDEMDSLKAFLGRSPNNAAFLESLGLKSATASETQKPLSPEFAAQAESARKILEGALQADPKNNQLWEQLGYIRLKLGDKMGSEDAFKKAAGHPTKIQLRRAESLMTAALKKDPKNSELWKQLGFIRKDLSDEPGSKEAFLKAASLNAEDAPSHFMLGLIFEKEKAVSEALNAYNVCVQNSAGDSRLQTVCQRHLLHLEKQ